MSSAQTATAVDLGPLTSGFGNANAAPVAFNDATRNGWRNWVIIGLGIVAGVILVSLVLKRRVK